MRVTTSPTSLASSSGKGLWLVTADRRETSLLQYLQELDLNRDADLADFVEKQRAVRARARENAVVVLDGAGEGTLAMAKQLGFDQGLREL